MGSKLRLMTLKNMISHMEESSLLRSKREASSVTNGSHVVISGIGLSDSFGSPTSSMLSTCSLLLHLLLFGTSHQETQPIKITKSSSLSLEEVSPELSAIILGHWLSDHS